MGLSRLMDSTALNSVPDEVGRSVSRGVDLSSAGVVENGVKDVVIVEPVER